VRTNDRGIQEHALLVELDLEVLEYVLPIPSPRPKREAVIDGFPRTEALGQISPRNARLESIEDRVDKEALTKLGCGTATTRKHS
jgi:hypothetical protein